MVNITSKSFTDGVWYVECSVELPSGSRSGTETVNLSEKATEAELKDAVSAAYE